MSSVCGESVVARTLVLDEPLTSTMVGDGYFGLVESFWDFLIVKCGFAS